MTPVIPAQSPVDARPNTATRGRVAPTIPSQGSSSEAQAQAPPARNSTPGEVPECARNVPRIDVNYSEKDSLVEVVKRKTIQFIKPDYFNHLHENNLRPSARICRASGFWTPTTRTWTGRTWRLSPSVTAGSTKTIPTPRASIWRRSTVYSSTLSPVRTTAHMIITR